MTFLAAAKQYALDKKIAFKLHKKGSDEYNAIKAIQETMKSEVVKSEVAPVKLSAVKPKKEKAPVKAKVEVAAAAVVAEPVLKVRKPRVPKSEKVPDAAEKVVKPKKTAKKEGGANLIQLDKPLVIRFD